MSESTTGRESIEKAIRAIGSGLLSDEDVAALAAASRIQHFGKGDQLVSVGEVPTAVTLLISGVARGYYIDAAGKDATDCIAWRPGEVLTPAAGLQTPSPVFFEAVSAIDVLMIDMKCVIDLLETSLGLNRLYNLLLLRSWDYHWAIKRVVSQCKAKDRYLWFLKEFPGVVDIVPGRHIATFLGMTPVTLSRLRSALRAEED